MVLSKSNRTASNSLQRTRILLKRITSKSREHKKHVKTWGWKFKIEEIIWKFAKEFVGTRRCAEGVGWRVEYDERAGVGSWSWESDVVRRPQESIVEDTVPYEDQGGE